MNGLNETKALIDFIKRSPSPFHVVSNMKKGLIESGFHELKEDERYKIEKGGKYFVTRNGSALIAFVIPTKEAKGYSIVSAHTDSPTFKLKNNPEVTSSNFYTVLNVEKYGGMLIAPWFDIPLSIAGRVFISNAGKIEERLISFDEDLVSIPNLAIHLNRKANEGVEHKVQKELLPLFAMGCEKGRFLHLIASKLGVKEEDILDSDLFLYNRMEPSIWGLDKAFFSSPKIDDLGCAFSAYEAIKESEGKDYISMVALFDNEEVGSGTGQGALSDLLSSTLSRIAYSLSYDEEKRYMMKKESFMLSADNGHALHPNYTEVSDPINRPTLNGGILIKYSANQKYTTDGESGAFVRSLCKEADVPYQVFLNNSDVLGGSTLGNLSTQKVSIKTADIGIAQLAMHSPYECAGCEDTARLEKLFKTFLSR